MAELLILAFDTHNPDPEADLFAWKSGHIISIQPDGHVWGSQEGLPKFWILKVTGLSVETAQDYLSKLEDISNPDHITEIAIRKWRFNYNKLPANLKNQLNTVGVVTVSASKVLDYIDRVTVG